MHTDRERERQRKKRREENKRKEKAAHLRLPRYRPMGDGGKNNDQLRQLQHLSSQMIHRQVYNILPYILSNNRTST